MTEPQDNRPSAVAWGALGGLLVGLGDALWVAWSGRLGLGPTGLGALLLVDAVPAAALGALWAGLLGLVGPIRRAGGPLLAVAGGSAPAAGMLALATWEEAPALGLPAESAVVGLVLLVLPWLLARSATSSWLRSLAAAGIGALVFAPAMSARVPVPLGRPATVDDPALVLITLDGVRADHVLAEVPATPSLERLAAEGTRLSQAVVGRPDTPFVELLGADDAGLLGGLARAGRPVGAFLPGPLEAPGLLDVQVRDDATDWPLGIIRTAVGRLGTHAGLLRAPARRRGDDVVDRALRWMASRPGAHATWIHLADARPPVDPPAPFDARYPPAPRAEDGLYDGAVAYVDDAVGRVLAALDEQGRAHHTLVVVVGLRGVGEDARSPAVHVPALLRLPGRVPVGERVDAPVRVADLGATLGVLLDVERDGEGIDLARALAGDAPPRRVVEVLGEGRAAARMAGAHLAWSEAEGWSAERWGPSGTRPWTRERLLDEVSRLATAPPPSAAEVSAMLSVLQPTRPHLWEARPD